MLQDIQNYLLGNTAVIISNIGLFAAFGVLVYRTIVQDKEIKKIKSEKNNFNGEILRDELKSEVSKAQQMMGSMREVNLALSEKTNHVNLTHKRMNDIISQTEAEVEHAENIMKDLKKLNVQADNLCDKLLSSMEGVVKIEKKPIISENTVDHQEKIVNEDMYMVEKVTDQEYFTENQDNITEQEYSDDGFKKEPVLEIASVDNQVNDLNSDESVLIKEDNEVQDIVSERIGGLVNVSETVAQKSIEIRKAHVKMMQNPPSIINRKSEKIEPIIKHDVHYDNVHFLKKRNVG